VRLISALSGSSQPYAALSSGARFRDRLPPSSIGRRVAALLRRGAFAPEDPVVPGNSDLVDRLGIDPLLGDSPRPRRHPTVHVAFGGVPFAGRPLHS